jgi:glycosyltransferase involved in cell wall biosynthesis
VIPSLYDPFANVMVEALAMGLSVVSSTANGGCEVLSAQTGLCIEQLFDPHSVAGVLLQALSRPKTKISAQMRRDSVKHLNFAQQLELIVNATLVPG